jgi:hypothetical protein
MSVTDYQHNSLRLDLKKAGKIIHEQETTINALLEEVTNLRRGLDNIKVRAYELGQSELHDMALHELK